MGNDILQKNRLLFPFECKILYFFLFFRWIFRTILSIL